MYPELKNYRKELNFKGPWIFNFKFLEKYGVWIGIIGAFPFYILLDNLDINNAFPWFIDYFLIISILSQYVYLIDNLKLGSKSEKEKIESIIHFDFFKANIEPLIFLRLQAAYFILLRAPYFLFIQIFYYQFLRTNNSNQLNFIQGLFFCILHLLFLSYDYFSFRDTVNKISIKPIPLTPDVNYIEEKFGYKISKSLSVNNNKIDKGNSQLNNKKIDKKDTMLKKFLDK